MEASGRAGLAVLLLGVSQAVWIGSDCVGSVYVCNRHLTTLKS